MMVVSLRANKKRILAFVILAAVVVGACLFLGKGEEEPPVTYSGGTNEERVSFLESFGWQVVTEPAETREVMIPAEFNEVYTTYNAMQKAQGFDVKPYAGMTCTQYKYKIENYPGESEVYATLLVYGEQIIGGDLACAEVDGFMHGFAADSARYGETAQSAGKKEKGAASSSPASQAEASGPAESAPETGASEPETSAVESTAADVIPEDAFPTD